MKAIPGVLRTCIFLLDSISFFLLGFIFITASLFAIFAGTFRKRRSIADKTSRRMLYFMCSSVEALDGLKHTSLLKTDLGGYFEKVYTVFFVHHPSLYIEKKYDKTHTVLQWSQHPAGRLRKEGFKKINSLLGEIRLVFRLLGLINRENITLIRAQDPHLLGFNALLLSRITGVPYAIHIVTNYDIKDRLVKKLAFPPFGFGCVEYFIEKFIIKNSYFVTASYRNYKEFALSHGANPEKTFSLRTWVDRLHFEDPRNRKDLRNFLGMKGKKLIFYVGRLHPVKFPEDLVRCMAVVAKRFGDAVLFVAGEGEMRPGLERLAGSLGIEGKIVFIGAQSQESLRNFYSTADVIVFTHAGMTLVEAGLSETPIVAYDYEWHSEFIGYDERGLLADFRDYKGLAEKVCYILSNPERGRELGRKAREFAMGNFNLEIITDIERRVLDKFLN